MTIRVTLILMATATVEVLCGVVIGWATDRREEQIEDWSA